jgi:hypothetical protein
MRLISTFPRTRILQAAFAVLLVVVQASCAPGVSTPMVPIPKIPEGSTSTPTTGAVAPTDETGSVASLPVVTPRGSDLVATDPSTVALASGQLQLVEFFRFT